MNTEKWGRGKARERYGSEGMKKYAEGGKVGDALVDPKGFAIDDPSKSSFGPPQRFSRASSPRAAEDAREQAAHRTRNTRAMPNSFPVGGEPKE